MGEMDYYVPKRLIMVFFLTLANVVSYIDRTNMGITVLKLNYDDEDEAAILSSFFYGYLVTQGLAGILIPKLGAKRIILIGMSAWALFDVMTVPAAHSLTMLLISRVGVGLGEGILYPCVFALGSAWFPVNERARLTSFQLSGQDIGTIVALGVTPQIVDSVGWQYVYAVFGLMAAVWLAGFSWAATDTPAQHASISEQERELIQAGLPRPTDASPPVSPWKTMVRSRGVWAVVGSHFCANYGIYVLLGWLPKYFKNELGVELSSHVVYTVAPYFCGTLGSFFFAAIAFRIRQRDLMPLLRMRQMFNSLGMFGPCVFLSIMAAHPPSSPLQATLLLSCSMFLLRATNCGYMPNMLDICPSHAGQMMALSNTVATIPGIVGNTLTGWVLSSTDSWPTVFAIAAAVYCVGGVGYVLLCEVHDIHAAPTERSRQRMGNGEEVEIGVGWGGDEGIEEQGNEDFLLAGSVNEPLLNGMARKSSYTTSSTGF